MFQGLPGAAFPRPSGHVNDFAQVLTADDRAYLENFLRTLERDTTAEVVVVTVTSLDGLTIEEYANRLFADWGIGTKTKDNGVLLLVAPAERKVRIEVGYGLEGSLPDGLAGEIIRTAIVPEFQQGNMRRGIGRGLDRISRVVRGDAAAVTAVTSAPMAEEGSGGPPAILIVPFFSIFVLLGGDGGGAGAAHQDRRAADSRRTLHRHSASDRRDDVAVVAGLSSARRADRDGVRVRARASRTTGGAPCERARLEARQPATQAPGSWAAATAPRAVGPTAEATRRPRPRPPTSAAARRAAAAPAAAGSGPASGGATLTPRPWRSS